MQTIKFIIFFFLTSSVYAQDYGFFGQKNTITVSGALSPRFASNMMYRNRPYNERSYPISYGGSIRYERQLSKNKQIGVEFGYYQTANRLAGNPTVFQEHHGFAFYGDLDNHPTIKTTVLNPMITFSRTSYGAQMPIGLINTIGLGPVIAMHQQYDADAVKVNYYDNNYGTPSAKVHAEGVQMIKDKTYNPDMYEKKTFGVRFFWQTAYNLPIAKNLIWCIAVRGNITVYTPLIFSKGFDKDYLINRSSFNRSFSLAEALNILEINTGLKFAF